MVLWTPINYEIIIVAGHSFLGGQLNTKIQVNTYTLPISSYCVETLETTILIFNSKVAKHE